MTEESASIVLHVNNRLPGFTPTAWAGAPGLPKGNALASSEFKSSGFLLILQSRILYRICVYSSWTEGRHELLSPSQTRLQLVRLKRAE